MLQLTNLNRCSDDWLFQLTPRLSNISNDRAMRVIKALNIGVISILVAVHIIPYEGNDS
jgi:hypothetical protein